MTPEEIYAAKRVEAETLIRQHAPARLQEPLISLLRPAIALTATRTGDAQIPIGASKFGGAPDVPADFVWPKWNEEPLGFLAQVNLEEVAPFDVEELLPKSGLLSFFFEWQGFPWGYDPKHKGGGRVFWFNEVVKRVPTPQILAESPLSTAYAQLEPKWTIPGIEHETVNNALNEEKVLWRTDEAYDAFHKVERQMWNSNFCLVGRWSYSFRWSGNVNSFPTASTAATVAHM